MARTGPTKSSWTAIAPSESRPAKRFPQVAKALGDLPAETVIDGEVVALDDSGHPDFHRLQHFQAEASRIRFYVFDLLILNGYDLTNLPRSERRRLLGGLKLRSSWIRISEQFDTSGDDMIAAVRQEQLEGVVAKRKDSLCEAGKRTGSWAKLRINRGQEFVGGGVTPGTAFSRRLRLPCYSAPAPDQTILRSQLLQREFDLAAPGRCYS
jgi:ATP-dependent DNA ligase